MILLGRTLHCHGICMEPADRGYANYTLVQVSVNDVIMIFAFAPLAAFLLGVTDIVVP